ncbi:hypothetical protein ACUXZZ_45440 (plasmid) [Streptomyces graminifolii]|uniref:hypothetical protein n=1 Tax=Streptomyces graminifolii TaxID=1266771 RepID=UPI004058C63A
MSRLARPVDRIATGSALVIRQLGHRIATWIRKGYREDLTGWRAALGCWLRLIVLLAGVYVLYRLVRAVPLLLWLLSTSWLLVSWRAGKPLEEPASTPSSEASTGSPEEDVRRLLREVMGDADTVHLRTVLKHLQDRGQWEGRTVTDLRRRLAQLDIAHDHRVKVGRVPTWGVRRATLDAPSPAPTEETSTTPSTAA